MSAAMKPEEIKKSPEKLLFNFKPWKDQLQDRSGAAASQPQTRQSTPNQKDSEKMAEKQKPNDRNPKAWKQQNRDSETFFRSLCSETRWRLRWCSSLKLDSKSMKALTTLAEPADRNLYTWVSHSESCWIKQVWARSIEHRCFGRSCYVLTPQTDMKELYRGCSHVSSRRSGRSLFLWTSWPPHGWRRLWQPPSPPSSGPATPRRSDPFRSVEPSGSAWQWSAAPEEAERAFTSHHPCLLEQVLKVAEAYLSILYSDGVWGSYQQGEPWSAARALMNEVFKRLSITDEDFLLHIFRVTLALALPLEPVDHMITLLIRNTTDKAARLHHFNNL